MSALPRSDLSWVMAVCGVVVFYFVSSNLHAQSETDEAVALDAVEVVAARRPLFRFPGSVTIVDAATIHEGQRKVSLSESLAQVPGITVLDRQNYAQDLQVQSRGFGARSGFGIRGIKLIVDGIPNSAVDGQGQAGSFPLDALDRIEVLRGPLALQYGNAAGGAIIGYTDLEKERGSGLDFWAGTHDSYRASAGVNGANEIASWRWRINANRFVTGGERMQSAAQRSQLNAVMQWTPRDGERIKLVWNSLSQPQTQDPLGLTRQALHDDPYGTDAAALRFDTRKSIENHQLGLQWKRDYAEDRRAWLNAHHIERDVVQFLALPVGAQIPASSAGGVIDLGRRTNGIALGHQWTGARGGLTLGFESGNLQETRRGYENFIGNRVGVRGRLRRDEINSVVNKEFFAVGDWHPADAWSVIGAARYSRIRFKSDDHFFALNNGDDSGLVNYSETSASLGVARAFAKGEIFASVGRGFETPTVTELAYRPDGGAGFNFGLKPAHFASGEIGARWHHGDTKASFAFYRINGNEEIVPADSRGGRASFSNAGRTQRVGIELGWSGKLVSQWTYVLAANWIQARFDEDFSYRVFANGANQIRTVEAGNRIPGIPRVDAYAELKWRSHADNFGMALEARGSDSIATDDRNIEYASGYARFALRMDWRPSRVNGWNAFFRIDNLFNRQHVGSVIVNEANSRYFEPGAGRAFTMGVGWNSKN